MNILTEATQRLSDLCAQFQKDFELPPSGAEMLVLELSIAHLMADEKHQTTARNYVLLLASQMPEGNYDEELMDRARDQMLEALKDD